MIAAEQVLRDAGIDATCTEEVNYFPGGPVYNRVCRPSDSLWRPDDPSGSGYISADILTRSDDPAYRQRMVEVARADIANIEKSLEASQDPDYLGDPATIAQMAQIAGRTYDQQVAYMRQVRAEVAAHSRPMTAAEQAFYNQQAQAAVEASPGYAEYQRSAAELRCSGMGSHPRPLRVRRHARAPAEDHESPGRHHHPPPDRRRPGLHRKAGSLVPEKGALPMRAALLLLALLPTAAAQLALTPSAPPVRPGQEVDVTISAGPGAAGLQWTLTVPAGYAIKTHSTSVAKKELHCNGAKCLLYGLNRDLIPAGPVALVRIGAPASASAGLVEIPLADVLAVTPNGDPLPATASTLSLRILAAHDLNGDGRTDGVDLLLMTDQILGRSACATADLNGDGRCDLYDAGILIRGGTQP